MLENERTKRLSTELFSSKSRPVPPVRRDLQIIPVEEDGRKLLLFYDSMKISKPGFALDQSVEPILSLLDGRKSLRQLISYFGNEVSEDEILKFIQMLDQQLLLESDYFAVESDQVEQRFENSDTREPALSGNSYPSNPAKLSSFLDDLLSKASTDQNSSSIPSKALYAPHIDLRVGAKQYADAFFTLKSLKPKRVVILATSHYSGYFPQLYNGSPYIGTFKSYDLPGRTIKTDEKAMQQLSNKGKEIGFTSHDRAHRIEHSIETHLLFASHIWRHEFEIVPILVGGIDEIFYMQNGDISKKIMLFAEQLRAMDTDDTFYLVSGDLSHVGKKFGDSNAAGSMRPNVESFDEEFMNRAAANEAQEMLKHISENYDPYRVCGFPPLYTFMNTFPDLRGTSINYHWWDEYERESAVSFGSISF